MPQRRRFRPPGLEYLFSDAGGTTGSKAHDVAIKLIRLYHRDRWRYSLRRRLSSVDAIPLDRPIFLLGLQTGGDTLIGRCLRRNRVVVSMSGNSGHLTGTDELGIVRNRMRRLPPSLWHCKFRSDLEHPLYGTMHNAIYASDELLLGYRRTAAEATPADAEQFKRLLREHVAVYAHDPGSARFLDKTHTNTVRVAYVRALLRDCDPFFVLVVRDPYVFCPRSIRRKQQPFAREVPDEHRLQLAAEHWANSYRLALADGAQVPNFTTVRFEDFLSDPERVIRGLCGFLQLEFDSEMIPAEGQALPFATLPGDHKWYPVGPDHDPLELSAREREIIDEHCLSLARRFGYSPSGSRPDPARALA